MDISNWKRPKKETGTEKVITNRNNELYREWLDRIKLAIMKKAVYERKAQDQENRTVIGGVSFWFQQQKDTDQHYLIFDRDPATWNLEWVKEDLDQLEYALSKMNTY